MAKKLNLTNKGQEPDANPVLVVSNDESAADVLVSTVEATAAISIDIDPVEQLRAELMEAKALLAKIELERMDAQRREAAVRDTVDRLTVQLAAAEPPQTTANAIRDYIDRQNAVRAERAARRDALLGAGIDLDELRESVAPLTGILGRNRQRARRAEQFAHRGA